eukprot:GILK01022313.1.p2 GENE.GILK01022313.1~~GILK01022313.1.p2  ORF type:complete len:102 (+),score=3.97 GILK01022313.1:917-1222(+)
MSELLPARTEIISNISPVPKTVLANNGVSIHIDPKYPTTFSELHPKRAKEPIAWIYGAEPTTAVLVRIPAARAKPLDAAANITASLASGFPTFGMIEMDIK